MMRATEGAVSVRRRSIVKLLILLILLLAGAWFAPAPVSHVENTIEITANRERLWAILADLPAARLWDPQLRDAELTSQVKSGVGTERRGQGALVKTSEKVTEWVPYNRIVSEVIHEPALSKFEASRIDLEPAGVASTRVRWSIDYQVKGGYLGNLADRFLFASVHQGRIDDGLSNLKRYAETGEVRF
jgi:uncharacterized membrane protein